MNSRAMLGAMVVAMLAGVACSSEGEQAETKKAGAGGAGGAGADTGGSAAADVAEAGAAGIGGNTVGGVPVALLEAYCDMEARCIPQCLCGGGGLCGCASPTRVAECASDVQTWRLLTQGEPCIPTFRAWLQCITQLDSCEQVQEFFEAHPDGVTTETPCGSEYLDLDCQDFEPLTEYSFG
jgi:hypothetical protein